MKKLILTLLMIFSLTYSYSQVEVVHVGKSKEQITQFLTKAGFKRDPEMELKLLDRIAFTDDKISIVYILDKSGICYYQTIAMDASNINQFVNSFNEDYVKIGELEWKDYKQGFIYRIGEPIYGKFFIMVEKAK